MIFRAPASKTAFLAQNSAFLQPGKAENETNGPTPVATLSNQTYFPVTSDLADCRHLSRKKLGDL